MWVLDLSARAGPFYSMCWGFRCGSDRWAVLGEAGFNADEIDLPAADETVVAADRRPEASVTGAR